MAVVINGTSGITGNTGTLISATTIGVGGATPSGSGSGITFPATQSASSDANTLDDYEEGTWTPTCPTTLTTATGTYVKIGSVVFFSIQIGVASNVSGVNFTLSLPFATSATLATRAGGWFAYMNGGSVTPGNTTWLCNAGAAEIYAYNINGSGRPCSEFNASYWIGGQFRTN